MDTSTNTGSKHTVDGFVDGVPANWKPTPGQPVPVIQCQAKANSTGEQCRRMSLRGARHCVKHGGQLPGVKEHAEAVVEAARLRIMNNTDMAIDVLERLMQPGTAEAIMLRAAVETLDRGGLKTAVDINVEVTNHGPDPAAQVRERLTRLVTPTPLAIEEEQIQEAEVIAEDDVPVEDTLF